MNILKDEARLDNRIFPKEFANTLGVSLDELGKEFDEMICNFEQQKSHLRNFVPDEAVINENETLKPPSPTPSVSSQTSITKKKRNRSSTAIQLSIRNTLRRKFSGKSTSRSGTLSRKKEHSSVSSLPQQESESSSVEH